MTSCWLFEHIIDDKKVGGVVGAVGRGLGETVTAATGEAGKPIGDGLASAGNGVQNASADVAHSVKKAGEGK